MNDKKDKKDTENELAKELVECIECGEEITEEESLSYEEDIYCESCYGDNFVICYKCGDETHRDDACYSNWNDEYWCNGCYNESHFECDNCREWFHVDDSYSPGDYCCETYCEECFNERFVSCDECGEWFEADSSYLNDIGCYCESCFEENGDGIIHGYEYKPYNIFKGNSKLKMGFELEIENHKLTHVNVEVAEELVKRMSINEQEDLIYLKEDSSINNGFEIVSHPFSFDWLLQNKDRFNPIFELPEKGFRSYKTTTCGFHVHMSKQMIGHFHLYKMLKFIYDNKPYILDISQRTSSNMNKWARLYGNGDIKPTRLKTSKIANTHFAINCQPNQTIEFRFFRGSLAKTAFFRKLEFCHSLYMFCKDAKLKELKPKNFHKYITKHKKEYINYYVFINAKNLMTENEI